MVRYVSTLTPAHVGHRVMVRYADADGRLTDAVGDLLAWRDDSLTLRTRRGEVTVSAADLVAGKPVPEPRLRTAGEIGVAQLHRISSRGWRPLRTAWLGGWLLRASGGFTGRGNSVLPLGDPGRPLDDAIAAVTSWYADQGLPPRFQCPLPDSADLDAGLAARGWAEGDSADMLVADVAAVLDRVPASDTLPTARLEPAPSPAWLASYNYRGRPLPPVAVEVLTHHDRAVFAAIPGEGDDAKPIGIARGAVDADWVGLVAVEVAPAARRRGVGLAVSRAVVAWGAEQGARHAYLQVDAHNAAGAAMYARMGFTPHSRYRYRLPPPAQQASG